MCADRGKNLYSLFHTDLKPIPLLSKVVKQLSNIYYNHKIFYTYLDLLENENMSPRYFLNHTLDFVDIPVFHTSWPWFMPQQLLQYEKL